MLIVQKFGGSSLADIERLRRAAQLCRAERCREHDVVMVVSAMGDATDHLIDLAHEISPSPSSRELDALSTTGEQQSAALMAIMLESLGTRALSLTGWQAGILTDGKAGSADIRLIAPGRITEALSRGLVPVVTGFQGVSATGDINSLGRGGSDTTAVALAAALDADSCRIYTDVDGIYTADPRLLPQAKKLKRIDFRDMLALARSGSQVLHPRSVELAMANAMPLELLSSFVDTPGSMVCSLKDKDRPELAGLTRCRESGELSLAGKAADAACLSRMVMELSASGIKVLSGSLGENSATVRLEEDKLMEAMALIHERMLLPLHMS